MSQESVSDPDGSPDDARTSSMERASSGIDGAPQNLTPLEPQPAAGNPAPPQQSFQAGNCSLSTEEKAFAELFAAESGLKHKEGEDKRGDFTVSTSTSGEVRVKELFKPRVGLSLSGGGIRSAVFNLGVLQGLNRVGLLHRIDHLATVSGGGYIGGWWSAWLHHRNHPDAQKEDGVGPNSMFPRATQKGEAPCVRHLREHANFLMPQSGVLNRDGVLMMAQAIPLLVLTLFLVNCLLALVVAMFQGCLAVPEMLDRSGLHRGWDWVGTEFNRWVLRASRQNQLAQGAQWIGPWGGLCPLGPIYLVFLPGVTLTLVFLAGLVAAAGLNQVLRVLSHLSAGRYRPLPGSRLLLVSFAAWGAWFLLLAPAHILALALTFWWGSESLKVAAVLTILPNVATVVGSVMAFTHRQWLINQLLNRPGASLKKGMPAKVYRAAFKLVPLGIIFVYMVLFSVLVIALMRTFPIVPAVLGGNWIRQSLPEEFHGLQWAVVLIVILAVSLVLFAPSWFSLHRLYRERIERAFVSHTHAGREAKKDKEWRRWKIMRFLRLVDGPMPFPTPPDIPLSELNRPPVSQGAPKGPFHLICCAVNDINSDSLHNLNEGARSAVLSPLGLWVDNRYRKWNWWDRMNLSSALTISGAAFNSQMGTYTMRLGRPFAFLLCAFNLRLGRWVFSPWPHRFWQGVWRLIKLIPELLLPGYRFYAELFSWTRIKNANFVHLSDGGHFENFGLYELIRRHCQYIIISEAGTDPKAASADLGTAIRRARTDFGVEVKLDVSPLIPDSDGNTRQHVATGKIIYPDQSEGIIIYMRTGITGDEPVDVQHYRNANPHFPYESIGDQFFDADQWEAYRGLGCHVAEGTFDFLLKQSEEEGKPGQLAATLDVSRIFKEVFWNWRSLPAHIQDRLPGVIMRHSEFYAKFTKEAPQSLIREIYPELVKLPEVSPFPHNVRDFEGEFTWARQAILLFECVWRELELEHYSDFPDVQPWFNLMVRWARADIMNLAWPTLKVLTDQDFVRFIEFNTQHKLSQNWIVRLTPDEDGIPSLTGDYPFHEIERLQFSIQVYSPGDPLFSSWNIGELKGLTLEFELQRKRLIAQIYYGEFQIYPGSRQAGLGLRCLRELVNQLHRMAQRDGCEELEIRADWSKTSPAKPSSVPPGDDDVGDDSPTPQYIISLFQETGFTWDCNQPGRFTLHVSGFQDRLRTACIKYGVWSTFQFQSDQDLIFALVSQSSPQTAIAWFMGLRVTQEAGTLVARWDFRNFYTEPLFRRRGWGKKCIQHLETELIQVADQYSPPLLVRLEVNIKGDDRQAVPWPEQDRKRFYSDCGFSSDPNRPDEVMQRTRYRLWATTSPSPAASPAQSAADGICLYHEQRGRSIVFVADWDHRHVIARLQNVTIRFGDDLLIAEWDASSLVMETAYRQQVWEERCLHYFMTELKKSAEDLFLAHARIKVNLLPPPHPQRPAWERLYTDAGFHLSPIYPQDAMERFERTASPYRHLVSLTATPTLTEPIHLYVDEVSKRLAAFWHDPSTGSVPISSADLSQFEDFIRQRLHAGGRSPLEWGCTVRAVQGSPASQPVFAQAGYAVISGGDREKTLQEKR